MMWQNAMEVLRVNAKGMIDQMRRVDADVERIFNMMLAQHAALKGSQYKEATKAEQTWSSPSPRPRQVSRISHMNGELCVWLSGWRGRRRGEWYTIEPKDATFDVFHENPIPFEPATWLIRLALHVEHCFERTVLLWLVDNTALCVNAGHRSGAARGYY